MKSVPKFIIPIDMSVRRLYHWLDFCGKIKIRTSCCSKNKNITLEQFKWIWWMEYGHRMWGRAIGAVFLIPATIFWARGWFKPRMKKRIIALGTLIALQVVIATDLK
jgi:heme A synthase